MPSADQVPVNSTHSTLRWPEWVVLIAGSTGSALHAVRPFQPSHHAGCPTRSLSRRECDGFLVALAAKEIASGIRRDVDRKSTRLNSSHQIISYAVFCLKKKKK